MYVKRETVSKTWPIPRKGTKYIVAPSHNKQSGIPLLVVMRDVLKLVDKRKELKQVLLEGKILVNNKIVKEENYSLALFDTISIQIMKAYYRVELSSNGKIHLHEIKESDANHKISKVTGKKILKKNLIQLNLDDGRNLISKEKINVSDSVLINFKDKKIDQVIPIKEKAKIVVIGGKHLGKSGIVEKISDKEVVIKSDEKELNISKSEVIAVR